VELERKIELDLRRHEGNWQCIFFCKRKQPETEQEKRKFKADRVVTSSSSSSTVGSIGASSIG
jgi:hypothetical protein